MSCPSPVRRRCSSAASTATAASLAAMWSGWLSDEPAGGVGEGPRAVDGVGLDRHAAEEIDVGARLDLDDLGAELGEQRPSLGDGDAAAQVDHAEPGERGTPRAVAARAPGRARREAP